MYVYVCCMYVSCVLHMVCVAVWNLLCVCVCVCVAHGGWGGLPPPVSLLIKESTSFSKLITAQHLLLTYHASFPDL